MKGNFETAKEKTSREVFTAEYAFNSNANICDNVVSSLSVHEDLIHVQKVLQKNASWVFFLQPNTVLADPLNNSPFHLKLHEFFQNEQYLVRFEPCSSSEKASFLINKELASELSTFLDAHPISNLLSDDGWDVFFEHFLSRTTKVPVDLAFTCENHWLGSFRMSNFRKKFTVDDRISPDTLKMTADFYYGTMPIPDTIVQRIQKGQIRRLNHSSDPSEVSLDGSVIFVDVKEIDEFVTGLGLQIQRKFVLLSGDGDECDPDCKVERSETARFVDSPYLRHWYMMNCKGLDVAYAKMSCLPNGLKQWNGFRDALQVVYEQGYGLKNGLEWKKPTELLPKKDRYVLLSFRISNNAKIRQPIYDMFCNSEKPISKVMNCLYDETINQTMFYSEYFANSRFVISPHGMGLDCYRTYEAIFMNTIPVVITSTLDSLYTGLPVLILKDWNELTIELMEKVEADFSTMNWDFRPLYVDYWYHKVRSHV
ncbi:hypothetical protein HDU83_001350 [Entophlyctis luteolus]|nr:hypothetical protein HDU83_001350 [Entophlyctis luteolus]